MGWEVGWCSVGGLFGGVVECNVAYLSAGQCVITIIALYFKANHTNTYIQKLAQHTHTHTPTHTHRHTER